MYVLLKQIFLLLAVLRIDEIHISTGLLRLCNLRLSLFLQLFQLQGVFLFASLLNGGKTVLQINVGTLCVVCGLSLRELHCKFLSFQ